MSSTLIFELYLKQQKRAKSKLFNNSLFRLDCLRTSTFVFIETGPDLILGVIVQHLYYNLR